jgi:hypothetical protein
MGIEAVPLRISDNRPGAILQPQPPPWDSEVKRGSARVSGAFMWVSAGRSWMARLGVLPGNGSIIRR